MPLNDLVNKTVIEVEKMKFFETDHYTLNVLNDCLSILQCLNNELTTFPDVKIETLKKSKILGMYAFKVFENSPLESMFNEIVEYL